MSLIISHNDDMMIWCFAPFLLDGRIVHIDYCQARASSEDDESSSSDDEASPGEDYGKSDSKDRQRIRRCRVAVDAVGGVRHVMCSEIWCFERQDKKTGGGYLKISISTSNNVTTCYNILHHVGHHVARSCNSSPQVSNANGILNTIEPYFSWFSRYFQISCATSTLLENFHQLGELLKGVQLYVGDLSCSQMVIRWSLDGRSCKVGHMFFHVFFYVFFHVFLHVFCHVFHVFLHIFPWFSTFFHVFPCIFPCFSMFSMYFSMYFQVFPCFVRIVFPQSLYNCLWWQELMGISEGASQDWLHFQLKTVHLNNLSKTSGWLDENGCGPQFFACQLMNATAFNNMVLYMSLYVFILSCSGTGRDQESLPKLGLERSSGQAGHHGTGRGQEGNWPGTFLVSQRCPTIIT